MKTLKEKFGELSAKIKASGQPARVWFPQYTPVSYTHLDVYKRQIVALPFPLRFLIGSEEGRF